MQCMKMSYNSQAIFMTLSLSYTFQSLPRLRTLLVKGQPPYPTGLEGVTASLVG